MNNGAIKLASTKYVESISAPEIEDAGIDDPLFSTHTNAAEIYDVEGEMARSVNSTEIHVDEREMNNFENHIYIEDQVVESTEQRRLDETFGSNVAHLFDKIGSSALSTNSVIDLNRPENNVVNEMNISSIRSDNLSGL